MNNPFDWVPFYKAFADKLLTFKNNRKALIEIICKVYESIGEPLPTLDRRGDEKIIPVDIDPFTVYGLFNKQILNERRMALCHAFKQAFSMDVSAPSTFNGIPVLNNLKATFYYFLEDRNEDDIDHLWDFFEAALAYELEQNETTKARFVKTYDQALTQRGVKWNITIALFWIRPEFYLSLDERNRWLLRNGEADAIDSLLEARARVKFSESFVKALPSFTNPPTAERYLDFLHVSKNEMLKAGYQGVLNFSYCAYMLSESVNKQKKKGQSLDEGVNEDVSMNDPMESAFVAWCTDKREKKLKEGTIRNYIFTLKSFSNETVKVYKTAVVGLYKALYNKVPVKRVFEISNLQEFNEIYKGVICLFEGGYDVSLKDEITEEDFNKYEAWAKSSDNTGLCLSSIKVYREFLQQYSTQEVTDDVVLDVMEQADVEMLNVYTKDDFLSDVFVDEAEYVSLMSLLKRKKNLVLQGPPGVGKTYAAKRLAYALLGEKASNRVQMVQFHQSYSYEDFIEGYRPNGEGGFVLRHGPFHSFCEKARNDKANKYVFIIDEINRGNLSKIFGELFMLLEWDKRAESLPLLYSQKAFNVPENVYIIGMMNTADRSLAMLDYALRRRFAFYDFKPAFDKAAFKQYQAKVDNATFNKLLLTVEKLNSAIAEDPVLGKGFCIGHSYFCHAHQNEMSTWLEEIVRYELIPLIEEYWFDEPDKVEQWSKELLQAL